MQFTIGNEKVEIRRTDSTRHKYANAITELMQVKLFDSLMDHMSGDVECPTGAFAQYGRRIIFEDERGNVWTETYPETRSAEQMYQALDLYYSAWSDEESAEDETAHAEALKVADAYLMYVADCAKENAEAYEWGAWRYEQGMPKGVLG